jgi:hypothetical protein
MDSLIVDWIILILVVPVIIVPIVLLWGFAGCSSFSEADPDKTPAPTNLKATAKSANLITLQWQSNGAETTKFKISRIEEGSPAPPPKTYDNLSSSTFDDTGDLKEGTTYFYTVQAVSPAAFSSDPSNQSAATAFPAAASNLAATPQEVNRIDLSWTNNSIKANQFIIQDTLTAVGNIPDTQVPKGASQPFPVLVPEGSAHQFQILASVLGFQENIPVEVKSLPSAPVSTKSLAFKSMLNDSGLDQPNRHGRCLVQRIPKGLLKNTGSQVKITVRGSKANSLTIDRIYISRPAASGNLWDSLPSGPPGGLTKIVDKSIGDPVVFLPAGTSKTLGPVNYPLDQANDLLIAFDISPDAGQGNLISVAMLGATAYLRAATQQAAVADRGPGYTDDPNTLYLVEKIEVL